MARLAFPVALVLAAALANPGRLAAQSPAPTVTPSGSPAPPPCAAPEHRQFDFWLGDWDVQNAAGQRLGTNRITSELGGCVVQEHWQGRGGVTGSSFNTYSAADGRWHQAWVDSGGSFLLFVGQATEAGMSFAGDLPAGGGGRALHRLSFEKLGGERVRQLWQVSKDGGSTWQVVFDGTYVRRLTSPAPAASPLGDVARSGAGCDDPAYRRLDFWLGRWDVTVDGRHVGVDRVEVLLGGCAVVEHWTDDAGGTGESLFFRDPMAGVWKQIWVTDHGAIKEKRLQLDFTGGARFQGEAASAQGRLPDRTTLTPREDGSVRQVIEQSEDGGRTWRVRFDALYRRKD